MNFLLGFDAQWASANAWMLPQAQEALSVQPNEPLPMTVGRHLGNVAAIMQGAAEVGAGAGVDASGGGLCLTGVGCLAGAPLVVAGTAVAAHRVTVTGAGAVVEGRMLGNLVVQAKSANQSSKPLQTGGHVINNSTAKSVGLTRQEANDAMNALKKERGLSNDFHGKIMSNGDVVDPHSGEVLDNILHYVH